MCFTYSNAVYAAIAWVAVVTRVIHAALSDVTLDVVGAAAAVIVWIVVAGTASVYLCLSEANAVTV